MLVRSGDRGLNRDAVAIKVRLGVINEHLKPVRLEQDRRRESAQCGALLFTYA